MPVLPLPLSLSPLKDMAKVDEVDYLADFNNLFSKMDDFEKFFKTGKVSYNMLRYRPGLAKVDYQVRYIEQKRKGNMQTTLTKTISYRIQHSNNERTL